LNCSLGKSDGVILLPDNVAPTQSTTVWKDENMPLSKTNRGSPQTFFPGGKNLLFAQKNNKKDTIFPKKV
jgi:hypothetical protein